MIPPCPLYSNHDEDVHEPFHETTTIRIETASGWFAARVWAPSTKATEPYC